MVENDRVDAERSGVVDLLTVRYAAVDGYDQAYILCFQAVDGRTVEAVAFTDPVGYVVHDTVVNSLQKTVQACQRGDAVGVVISVYGHLFPTLDSPDETLHPLFHVLHEIGAVQVVKRGVQIAVGRLKVGDLPVDEDLGYDRTELEFLNEQSLDFFFRFGQFPSCDRQHRYMFFQGACSPAFILLSGQSSQKLY